MNRQEDTLMSLAGVAAALWSFAMVRTYGFPAFVIASGLIYGVYWFAVARPGYRWGPLTKAGKWWIALLILIHVGLPVVEIGVGVHPLQAFNSAGLAGAAAVAFLTAGLAGWKRRNITTWFLAGLSFGLLTTTILLFLRKREIPLSPDAQDFLTEAEYEMALADWTREYAPVK